MLPAYADSAIPTPTTPAKTIRSTESVLYSFAKAPDGMNPQGSLIQGRDGNLYGVTLHGGTSLGSCGTVFKITTAGVETVLHSFACRADAMGSQEA